MQHTRSLDHTRISRDCDTCDLEFVLWSRMRDSWDAAVHANINYIRTVGKNSNSFSPRKWSLKIYAGVRICTIQRAPYCSSISDCWGYRQYSYCIVNTEGRRPPHIIHGLLVNCIIKLGKMKITDALGSSSCCVSRYAKLQMTNIQTRGPCRIRVRK